MKVGIIFDRFLDATGREQTVGGVQSYIFQLGKICREMGSETLLFQQGQAGFERFLHSLRIIGVSTGEGGSSGQKQGLYKAARRFIDRGKDILIFAADHFSVKTDDPKAILIQHGVSWDLPARFLTSKRAFRFGLGAMVKKGSKIIKAIKNFENCPNRVCVDYNFLNWYKTVTNREVSERIWVIPNFAQIASEDQLEAKSRRQDPIRILFARRFMPFRGTRIMAEAAMAILKTNDNVRFTFAGEGPDEMWLRRTFDGDSRVSFQTYLPQDSLKIHLDRDIAVVPSFASEGTSLSVAEAMGAGCAVVAAAVGGITNMIIDGYNGLLVFPRVQSFESAIRRLIEDKTLRDRLAARGHETASAAFSSDRWREQWQDVLETVAYK